MLPRLTRRKATPGGDRRLRVLVPGLLAIGAGAACAEPPEPQRPPVELRSPPVVQPEEALTLDRAVAAAEQRYRARVVRASTVEVGGRRVYLLRLLSEQGRVWTIRVDALTGAMN